MESTVHYVMTSVCCYTLSAARYWYSDWENSNPRRHHCASQSISISHCWLHANYQQLKENATTTQLLTSALLNCAFISIRPYAGSNYGGNYWRLCLPFSPPLLPFCLHSFAHSSAHSLTSATYIRFSFDPYVILCPLNYSSALSHVSKKRRRRPRCLSPFMFCPTIDGEHCSSHPLTS